MMAHQKKWDPDFAIELLESNQPIELVQSIPVGGRGRNRLNIPINLLTIPQLKSNSLKHGAGRGRGRQLRNVNDPKLCLPDFSNVIICESSNGSNAKKFQSDSEWPEICQFDQETQKENSTVKRKKTIKNKALHLDSFLLSFPEIRGTFDKPIEVYDDSAEEILQLPVNKHKEYQINYKADNKNEKNMTNSHTLIHNNKFHSIDENKHIGNEFINPETNNNCQFSTASENEKHVESKPDWSTCSNQIVSSIIQEIKLPVAENVNKCFDKEYLSKLENKDCFVLIENVPANADDETFKELIESCGEIHKIVIEINGDSSSKTALVEMGSSLHCDWLVSCLEGSIYDDSSDLRLTVYKIDDLLAANN